MPMIFVHHAFKIQIFYKNVAMGVVFLFTLKRSKKMFLREIFCLIQSCCYCFHSFFVFQEEKAVCTFCSGKLDPWGMKIDFEYSHWTNWRIQSIEKGLQGSRLGIEIGWKLYKFDGKFIKENNYKQIANLIEKENSGHEICFLKPVSLHFALRDFLAETDTT